MSNSFYLVLNNFDNLNQLIEFNYETDYKLSDLEKDKYDLMLLSEFTKSDEIAYIGEYGSIKEHVNIGVNKIPELLLERGVELKGFNMNVLDLMDITDKESDNVFIIQTSIVDGVQFGYFNKKKESIDKIQDYITDKKINTDTYQIDDELLNASNLSLSGREAFMLEEIDNLIGFNVMDKISVFDLENNIKMFISDNIKEIDSYYKNNSSEENFMPFRKELSDNLVIELEQELNLDEEYKGYDLDDINRLTMLFTIIHNDKRYKIDTDRYMALNDVEKEYDILFVDKDVKAAFESFFESNKEKRKNTIDKILSNIGSQEKSKKRSRRNK